MAGSSVKKVILSQSQILASGGKVVLGVPCDGDIESIQVLQSTAGTTGVDVNTIQATRVRAGATQALLSTAGKITQAAGAGVGIETDPKRTAIATPTGCTKPVLNNTYRRLRKGDAVEFSFAFNGSYSPFPTFICAIVLRPTF